MSKVKNILWSIALATSVAGYAASQEVFASMEEWHWCCGIQQCSLAKNKPCEVGEDCGVDACCIEVFQCKGNIGSDIQ